MVAVQSLSGGRQSFSRQNSICPGGEARAPSPEIERSDRPARSNELKGNGPVGVSLSRCSLFDNRLDALGGGRGNKARPAVKPSVRCHCRGPRANPLGSLSASSVYSHRWRIAVLCKRRLLEGSDRPVARRGQKGSAGELVPGCDQ